MKDSCGKAGLKEEVGKETDSLKLVFLGPPGVGKGTQAQMLSDRYGLKKVSTGDILREAVANRTPLGMEAKSFMDQGKLVPDEVVIGLVREWLMGPGGKRGYVLDGFPRTLVQAKALSRLLKETGDSLDRVISLDVPEAEIIKRLTGRRSCPGCQRVYHLDFNPPRRAGQCDECAAELVQRKDDQEETVKRRLKVYKEETAPLIQYYRDQDLLHSVDGTGPIKTVFERLLAVLP
jgi:adenylate kinase